MPSKRKSSTHRRARRIPAEQLSGGTENRDARFIGNKSLRVIGGDLRRRAVQYNGDRQTRPMKDSVRENVFNILGAAVRGSVAWDLFAGTGILAIESLSRGARHAVAIETSRAATRLIRQSADQLGISPRLEVLHGDTFRLAPNRLEVSDSEHPRIIFCCPPYRLWESEADALGNLVALAMQNAPGGSVAVCEMDARSHPDSLPPLDWDLRNYGNVKLAFGEMPQPDSGAGRAAAAKPEA